MCVLLHLTMLISLILTKIFPRGHVLKSPHQVTEKDSP